MRTDYRVNRNILMGLRAGRNVWGERREGKTYTLLCFIAFSGEDRPFVAVKNRVVAEDLKYRWDELFPDFPPLRMVLSKGELRGMRGVLFADEVADAHYWAQECGFKFMGGVYS